MWTTESGIHKLEKWYTQILDDVVDYKPLSSRLPHRSPHHSTTETRAWATTKPTHLRHVAQNAPYTYFILFRSFDRFPRATPRTLQRRSGEADIKAKPWTMPEMLRVPNWGLWFLTVWSRVYGWLRQHTSARILKCPPPLALGQKGTACCESHYRPAPPAAKAMPKAHNCWPQMTRLVVCFRPARPFNPSASSFWFRASALHSLWRCGAKDVESSRHSKSRFGDFKNVQKRLEMLRSI